MCLQLFTLVSDILLIMSFYSDGDGGNELQYDYVGKHGKQHDMLVNNYYYYFF